MYIFRIVVSYRIKTFLSQYFIQNYQNQTRSAPNERFAFAGFDISYYFLNALNTNGELSTDMFLETDATVEHEF